MLLVLDHVQKSAFAPAHDILLNNSPAREKEAERQNHLHLGLDDVEGGRNFGELQAFPDSVPAHENEKDIESNPDEIADNAEDHTQFQGYGAELGRDAHMRAALDGECRRKEDRPDEAVAGELFRPGK